MADALVYAVKLLDGMSSPAREGAAALGQLTGSLKAAKNELSAYQAQLSRAKQLGDIEGYRKYSDLVTKARKDVFDLSAESETGLLSLAGPFGAAATAALALGTAVAGLTYETLKFAASATEAREKALVLFDALGDGSEGAGKKTLALLDDLEEHLPNTRKQLVGWTKDLEALGITDLGELQRQLVTVSSAQALLGDEGAEKYLTLTRRIKEAVDTTGKLKLADRQLAQLGLTGANVNDVAKQLGLTSKTLQQQLKAGTADAAKFGDALENAILKKGAGPLQQMGLQLSTVLTKGADSFEHLFDSIDFAPLSTALSGFFDIFSQAEPSGQALKSGISTGLNAVIKLLGEGVEQGEIFFLRGELGFLKAQNFIRPYIKLWDDVTTAIGKANEPLEHLIGLYAKAVGYLPKLLGGAVVGEGAGTLAAPLSREAWEQQHGAAGPPSRAPGQAYDRQGIITSTPQPGAPVVAPPHADGGIVAMPAPGEVFASVAPGEQIVPAGQGAVGGGGIQIGHVELHVTAPHGVTDATEVSAQALARALERYQLAAGRG